MIIVLYTFVICLLLANQSMRCNDSKHTLDIFNASRLVDGNRAFTHLDLVFQPIHPVLNSSNYFFCRPNLLHTHSPKAYLHCNEMISKKVYSV